MLITCNTRCTNATLTGAQRYTMKILEVLPEKFQKVSPSFNLSRGMKGHLWEQLVLPSLVGKSLLWSPSNSGPINVKRQVVTLHDLVSFDHPEWLNNTYVRWYNLMLPRVLRKADHIITVSEFTRQRLLELFKISPSKVTTIYNGSAPLTGVQNCGQADLTVPFNRYILSLGSIEPRKNIPLLLKAWKNVQSKLPDDVGLIIVGAKGNDKVYADAGINEIPEKVHFTGHVPDQHIVQLYSNALFFVYLSVYEGFGLPPLEAMSAGTPVLAGNMTAIPEVIEGAGVLIDPFSLSECEKALIDLVTNEALRRDLVLKGKIQAGKFDWRTTAANTYEVLQRYQ